METNIIVQKQENIIELAIIQRIHEIRGVKVILDFDLAEIYEVETKNLKRSVRHNIERFPGDFMFELTENEWEFLRCKNCTSKQNEDIQIEKRGGTRYLPFAFTEQGVAMLSGVLRSQKAIQENINIMRAFVAIRQYVLNYAELKHELYDFMRETNIRLDNTEVKVEDVFDKLSKLFEQKSDFENRQRIGFNKNWN
jgi:hypothetical protein